MRIGIEAQRLFRRTKYGMDVVALEIINRLQKIDSENSYVIFVREGEDSECLKLTNPNFSLCAFSGKSYLDWEQVHLPKMASKFNLDLLHCTNNTLPLFTKIPIVLTLHDTIYMEKIEFFDKRIPVYQQFGNYYRKILAPWSVEKAKKIITVSDFEVNEIHRQFALPKGKVKRIHNGVAEDYVRYGLHSDDIANKENIMVIGNIHPRKNIRGSLKAFNILVNEYGVDTHLLLTNMKEHELQIMLDDISLNSIRERIQLCGYISRDEFPAFIASAKVLLYPSIREGFGIPILEGFAVGTPVVTSNTSSMPEVAGDAALIANPNDPRDIAEKLFQAYSNDEKRKSMIELGKSRAAEFSWDKTAQSVLDVYNEVYSSLKNI